MPTAHAYCAYVLCMEVNTHTLYSYTILQVLEVNEMMDTEGMSAYDYDCTLHTIQVLTALIPTHTHTVLIPSAHDPALYG
jgi:hypothetical protein